MQEQNGPRIKTTGDWHNLIDSLNDVDNKGQFLLGLRRKCWLKIESLRGRPLFVYAVQYPCPIQNAPISISLQDVDGFVDLIECSDPDSKEVDILIHSPGGDPSATERIVSLLRDRFDRIAFLVPHSAYSAATMLALSGNEIILHPSASLGPIDPQINGTPARAIKRGFERAKDALMREGPGAIPAYAPLIEQHSLEKLELCEDAEKLSEELATTWLSDYMFGDMEDGEKKEQVTEIVSFLAEYDDHKTHSRPLTFAKLEKLGLHISLSEGELRWLLREAHILLSGFLSVSPFVKIFENSTNLSWGTQFSEVLAAPPMPVLPPPSSGK